MKSFLLLIFIIVITIESKSLQAPADSVEIYASGLVNPMGIEIDSQGRLWVAESGTGSNDGRVSVITTDGIVHPFITGLPSVIYQGDPSGTAYLKFDVDGKLLVLQGSGLNAYARSVLVIDTSGFVPGNPPLGLENIEDTVNLGDFAVSHGAELGNPFRIVIGPNDDWFIVDSNLNGIIRREKTTGNLSIFSQWGNVVPTGIVLLEDKFFVGSLTPFPFISGNAKIYEVDFFGNNSILHENLTTVVDLDVDPVDNKLVFAQFAIFNNGFQPGTSGIFKISNGTNDTIIYGYDRISGIKFDTNGDLYAASFPNGEIYKVTFKATDVDDKETAVESFQLLQNYPNPFNPETKITWNLPEESYVTLIIYDILGNETAILVDEEQSAGRHELTFNGSELSSGVYFYRLEGISSNHNFSAVKKLIFMK
jgi:hypothetical protein